MTENPYKGVPGGDPRLRDANQKKMVMVSFICVKCNKPKQEKLPEGKDVTGRTCIDCRNEESARKQQEQAKEASARWAARRREIMETPLRTNEEKAALLAEWKDAPHERCSSCGDTFPVSNPAMPFLTDNIDRPNAIMTVEYTSDPWLEEVRGVTKMDWYCRRCHREIAWDV